ncbi:uncharacterized protein LOC122083075 isoform X2 [Macadamia integrifolia]|uniref:uncharacterized protein LOC122083075 isoform X2 n=1 Tax=Macadamia integrifolia TaxID=60698 RepID=UPI001C4EAED9|nr:uncharacterized protein LOC122083075 isoform X2 [Macadamia integrifolia]
MYFSLFLLQGLLDSSILHFNDLQSRLGYFQLSFHNGILEEHQQETETRSVDFSRLKIKLFHIRVLFYLVLEELEVMPVSGYEEPGFKPVGWHPSDSIAGVPIKKRRFPFVVSQSPPQTQSSQAVEPGQTEKEHSDVKAESSSNEGDARDVSGISGTTRSYSLEEKGSGAEKSNKQEVMAADRPVYPKIPENAEQQLVQKGTTMLGIVEGASWKEKLESNNGFELLNSSGNSELPLVPKEPTISALTGLDSHGSCGKQELIDPCSLNLTLAKADPDVKNRRNVSESAIGGTLPPANRSHWDLNTMMDTWEDSMNDASTSHKLRGADGSDGAAILGIEPVVSSAVMAFGEPESSSGVTLGKDILDKNEYKSKLRSFSNPHNKQIISDDLLNLCLSPSGLLKSNFSREQYCMPRKIDSMGVETNLKLSETVVSSARKFKMVGRIVKSEPFDEVNKQDLRAANASSVKISDTRIVKSEPLEDHSQESLKSLKTRNMKLVDDGYVKSEPVYKNYQGVLKPAEEIQSQLKQATCTAGVPIIEAGLHFSDIPVGEMQSQVEQATCTAGMPIIQNGLHCSELPTCRMETYGTGRLLGPSESHAYAVDIPRSAEVSCELDLPSCTNETPVKGDVTLEACGSYGGVNSDVASESVGNDAKESKTGVVMIATSETKASGGIDLESSRLKLTHELRPDSYQHGEVADSDEEKINISTDMLEDDSYDTGDESDGSHAMGVTSVEDKQHRVEDDFEDGEVREPLLHEGGECEEKEKEHIDYGESENKDASMCGDHVSTSTGEDRSAKIEENGESNNAFCGGECNNSLLNETNDQDAGKVATSQESLGVRMPHTESDEKVTIRAARREILNCSGREDGSMGHEGDLTSNHALCDCQGTATGDIQSDAISQQEHVKGADPGEINHLVLPKADPSIDGDEATKDANGRGTRRRIINLPRASNGSSSSRLRTIPGRSLPSLIEKEIYTDVVLKGDKIHGQGNRDESYNDGARKFERERNQDQAVGNSGSDFLHCRGRVDNRLDTLHGDWDSDHDFGSEHYNGPIGLRLPRPKNAVAVAAAKFECNGLIVAPDGTVVGSGRGGRKPLNDDLSVFCHPLSRRRSPVGRGGPGTHVVRRPTRDVSPDRCTSGLRHEEKYLRGMPEDILDPVFSHSQPQYDRVDPFLMGGRSFSPVHRRVPPRVPRIRSKSPPRSRSPGPWSSPRRSPDGFDGHPAMTRRRSPPVYRMDRMRSPHQRPCFADDIVGRRHGSPPYMSRLPNEIREMGSSRENEHPRPFISNRSPSARGRGRGLPRNNRRFDMIDPRERIEADEYFGGPMRSGRFHELGGEGVDERRKCNERRGPIRSFRPPYNDNHVENFRFHFEDGPRPNQPCPEADTEFHERGSFREREFDRRLKFRPGNMHRRTRSIEEQEENYRHGGQGWNDAGFDDVARVKRRRF